MLEPLPLKPSQLLLATTLDTKNICIHRGMTTGAVSANIHPENLIGTIQCHFKRRKKVVGRAGVCPVPQMPMC